MSNYSFLLKYIIIGDAAVGKSCILMRYTDGTMREEHDTTIGVEFGAKSISLRGYNIKLQIWDTAGQENFRSIIRSYYRSAIGALLVYDVSRRETFHHLQIWLDEIRNNGNPNMTIILCANKVDLERQVSREEGEAFARQFGLMFFETSAKTGENIERAFDDSCETILDAILDKKIDLKNDPGVKVGKQYKEASAVTETKIVINKEGEEKPKEKSCC